MGVGRTGDAVGGVVRTVRRTVGWVTTRGAGGIVVGTVTGGAVVVVVEEVVVVDEVELVELDAACRRTPSPGVRWGMPAIPIPKRTPGTTTASAT